MKKWLVPLLLLLLLSACGESPAEESERWAFPPMVMVNGELYLDTGYPSTITERCGTPDGTITTSVDGSQRPTENEQSNFGTGYDYQLVGEGVIELLLNDKWWVFATEEARKEIQFPAEPGADSIEKLTSPPPLTLVCGKEAFEALQGTFSWWYDNDGGTQTAIEADGLHPLQAQELMSVLPADTERVTLEFAVLPDKVSAAFIVSDPNAEKPDAHFEQCEVKHLCIDTDKGCFDQFILELSGSARVYEIVAEWTRLPDCGGTARYSFRTE